MSQQTRAPLVASARRALDANRHHGLTVPHLEMFRAGYLWDIAVIAKGIAVHDAARAAGELLRFLESQWTSGMLPNEVYFEPKRLRGWVFADHSHRPVGITTSGITQPPMIIRAVLEVGRRLDAGARATFYRATFPSLGRYVRWVIRERMGASGPAVLIHPYESGMDNRIDLAEWMAQEWRAATNPFGRTTRRTALGGVHALRRLFGDLRTVPVGHRSSDADLLAGYLQTRHIRRHGYDLAAIRASGVGLLVEDVGYNAVLLDAISCLQQIADDVRPGEQSDFGDELRNAKAQLTQGLASLWCEARPGAGAGYYSRDHRTGEPSRRPTVAGLFPLLSLPPGDRARELITTLVDPTKYWTAVAPPSAPAYSDGFDPNQYWRGAAWPFPTDILETALQVQGEHETAAELRRKYLSRPHGLVHAEYDNPITGEPLGARPFSPSAALAVRFASHDS